MNSVYRCLCALITIERSQRLSYAQKSDYGGLNNAGRCLPAGYYIRWTSLWSQLKDVDPSSWVAVSQEIHEHGAATTKLQSRTGLREKASFVNAIV